MKVFKSKFLVGIHTCEMTYTPTKGLLCEWSPSVPRRDLLNDPVRMKQYRDGRDALLAEIAKETGFTVAVVETW